MTKPLVGAATLLALFTGLTWYALQPTVEAWDPQGEWCWNAPSQGEVVDGYRVYWSVGGLPGCWNEHVVLDYDLACNVNGRPGLCCDGGMVPYSPAEDFVLYVVTAYNAGGESDSEHGPVCP
jgi:hypothetical protein